MKQEFEQYTQEDKEVWKILFNQQIGNLQQKASNLYLASLAKMNSVLNADNIPRFEAIEAWFEASTGWKIHVVPGPIPVEEFFGLLAEKKFCSSTWLRSKQNLDYLEEPDMFHDIFGHIPLLSNPLFSTFMIEFGKLGWTNRFDRSFINQLERLYWFTIEFGVVQEDKPRAYGAGILSSYGETNHVDTGAIQLKPFNLEEIMNTPFVTDSIQSLYYSIASVEELMNALDRLQKLKLENYAVDNR